MMSSSEKPYVDHSTTSFAKMSTPVSFAKESVGFSNGWKFLIGFCLGLIIFVLFRQCMFIDSMKSTHPDKIVIITNIRSNDQGDANYNYEDSEEGLVEIDEEGLINNVPDSTDKSPEGDDGQIDLGPCKPGEVRKIDCNTCRCTEDGNFACTKMFCQKNNIRLEIPVD